VQLGGSEENGFEDMVTIHDIEIIKSPTFEKNLILNDIALIKLNTPVTLSDAISVACLPLYDSKVPDVLTLVGYTSKTTVNEPLISEGKIPIIDRKKCFDAYDEYVKKNSAMREAKPVTDSQFCAGGVEGEIDFLLSLQLANKVSLQRSTVHSVTAACRHLKLTVTLVQQQFTD
jgi:hypothetical protein